VKTADRSRANKGLQTTSRGVPTAQNELIEAPSARLRGRYCDLRQLAPTDYDWFYNVCMQPQNLMTFRFGGVPPSPDRFAGFVWQGVSCQFVITREGRPADRIGVVTFYGQNDLSQVASFATVFQTGALRSPWAWEGVVLAINHFFRITQVRKLCFEVGEWNLPRFRGFEAFGMFQEGCLREHDYMDGRWWDRYLYALFRSDWERARVAVLKQFGGD
jgi:RimJ/RimL family protein N-acetyltransferase